MGSRQVLASFDGGDISSDGGSLLLRKTEELTSIIRQFAACFTDHPNPGLIEHPLDHLVARRVYALALGYEDLKDHDGLRHDPLLTAVVGKQDPRANPRFVVTSLDPKQYPAKELYEHEYRGRGEMENRIKEQQLHMFADRTSAATTRANQIRLFFSSIAYALLEALRRLGLTGTSMDQAQCQTIRLRLLKIGALVQVTVRKVWV